MDGIKYTKELPSTSDYFNLFLTTSWNDKYRLRVEDMLYVLEKSWLVISAFKNDDLVGIGRVISDGVHAMVYDLIVHPEYQRNGIGSTILKMLVDESKANNIRDIQLFSSKGKRVFYEKNGFILRADDSPGMELNHDH